MLAVAGLACGPGPGGGWAAGPEAASQFCLQVRANDAQVESRCQTGGAADWLAFDSEFSPCASLDALVVKGTVRYHRDRAAACLALLSATRDCHAAVDCPQVLEGTLGPGAPCSDDAECPSNASCLSSGFEFNTCGALVCTVLPTKAGDSCVEYQYCFGNSECDNGVCVPELPEGAACGPTTTSCNSGLTCNLAGTCAPLGGIGTACASELGCDGGLFCTATGTCAPRIALGGVCDPTTQGCVRFAACDMATAKCVRAGHLGEPCDATFFCVHSVCHDGGTASSHCDAFGTNGSPCTFGIDCASAGCLNNVCASCT
jgi:hypothetical protein